MAAIDQVVACGHTLMSPVDEIIADQSIGLILHLLLRCIIHITVLLTAFVIVVHEGVLELCLLSIFEESVVDTELFGNRFDIEISNLLQTASKVVLLAYEL